ncbi:MAG: bifunctional hydroxymethylpyrimidine kinase/phosphomethylpyrimidine kinase [Hyphomicrobiales bacterium]|nr:bifunctional hydroxymethylpyrimidine kinase/phosphomethylpyrimidine kinase [Hyphomicrobiales bacterium]
MTPIAVTIAGSDSSGGAGIQADLKTFSALGVYGASVIAALTAQNTLGVQGVHDVPVDFIAQQMDSVFSDLAVNAVKIGMLSRAEAVETVVEGLDRYSQEQVVLDPVMVAKGGESLLEEDAVDALRTLLLPRALIITPNLAEAARLLEVDVAEDEDKMADQAAALLDLGPRAVLLKGGHGTGAESADIFFDGGDPVRLAAARTQTANTHGTGCTLSSAIAAGLAHGFDLLRAVAHAKAYVSEAIAHADALVIGSGRGPVHHFHAIWGKVPMFGVLPGEAGDDPSGALHRLD